ncbi:hypothetical protein HDU84_000817 [Entophlyctis sp. JEL0112]|nr:hypothetical protein HDU84_000817 [Entophlyctis sp. JEL0112]
MRRLAARDAATSTIAVSVVAVILAVAAIAYAVHYFLVKRRPHRMLRRKFHDEALSPSESTNSSSSGAAANVAKALPPVPKLSSESSPGAYRPPASPSAAAVGNSAQQIPASVTMDSSNGRDRKSLLLNSELAKAINPLLRFTSIGSRASGRENPHPSSIHAQAPAPFDVAVASKSHNNVVKVKQLYTATANDELSLVAIGDEIYVLQMFDDGWAFGVDRKRGSRGVFPVVCCSGLPVDSPRNSLSTSAVGGSEADYASPNNPTIFGRRESSKNYGTRKSLSYEPSISEAPYVHPSNSGMEYNVGKRLSSVDHGLWSSLTAPVDMEGVVAYYGSEGVVMRIVNSVLFIFYLTSFVINMLMLVIFAARRLGSWDVTVNGKQGSLSTIVRSSIRRRREQ